jgi:hypothetical protein
VVASKCSWNHFISETFKIVQSVKTHFLQEKIYAFASGCRGVEKIHFVKSFQLICRIYNDLSSITKATSCQCWFQSRERGKIIRSQDWKDVSVLSHYSLLRYYWRKISPVLENFHERETKVWFSIIRGVFVTSFLRRRRMSV